jgi:hypothetical protein
MEITIGVIELQDPTEDVEKRLSISLRSSPDALPVGCRLLQCDISCCVLSYWGEGDCHAVSQEEGAGSRSIIMLYIVIVVECEGVEQVVHFLCKNEFVFGVLNVISRTPELHLILMTLHNDRLPSRRSKPVLLISRELSSTVLGFR